MNVILTVLVLVIAVLSILILAALIYLSHNDANNIQVMGPYLVDKIKLIGKKTDES